jgi:uncharacterized membrane protein YeaQ/YmgE (transglycosylase-associated protein family)
MLFGLIGWVVFGAIVGLVARMLMPGRDSAGCILTIVLGVVGAVIGGWVGQLMGFYREGEPAGFLMAVVGAILVLAVFRMVKK